MGLKKKLAALVLALGVFLSIMPAQPAMANSGIGLKKLVYTGHGDATVALSLHSWNSNPNRIEGIMAGSSFQQVDYIRVETLVMKARRESNGSVVTLAGCCADGIGLPRNINPGPTVQYLFRLETYSDACLHQYAGYPDGVRFGDEVWVHAVFTIHWNDGGQTNETTMKSWEVEFNNHAQCN